MASPLAAANAYANAAKLAANITRSALPGNGADLASNTSFTSVLKEAMDGISHIGHKSDTETRNMAAGKSNMVDVVTAVAETEVAIDAVVAVRDKVIAAYDEIMKMPI